MENTLLENKIEDKINKVLIDLSIRLNNKYLVENIVHYLSIKRMIEESGNSLSRDTLVRKFIEKNPTLALSKKGKTGVLRYKDGEHIFEVSGEYALKTFNKGKVVLSGLGLENAFGYICRIDYDKPEIHILTGKEVYDKLGQYMQDSNICYIKREEKNRLLKKYYIRKEVFYDVFDKDAYIVRLPKLILKDNNTFEKTFKSYKIAIYENGYNHFIKIE